jgi:hypothetical protein
VPERPVVSRRPRCWSCWRKDHSPPASSTSWGVPTSLAGFGCRPRGTSAQNGAEHGSPIAARGRGPHFPDGSSAGCRRGQPFRWNRPDNRTGRREGTLVRDVSRQAKGREIRRELGNSTEAPEAPASPKAETAWRAST